MKKTERDKICLTCVNHVNDSRHGIICGLTNNFSHFNGSCKDFSQSAKKQASTPSYNPPSKRKKEKTGIGSIFGIGVGAWVVIKIVLIIIKLLSR